MAGAGTARAAVTLFAERLRRRFGPRLDRLVLFGSHARGQATEHSDIDLLTVVDGLTHADTREIDAMVGDILTEHDVLLSPLVLSTARYEELRARERRLPAEIEREGIPV